MPHSLFGVVYQQPPRRVVLLPQVQVVPRVQIPCRRPFHALHPFRVQRRRYLCRQAAVPRHHPVGRKVIQRLRDHAQAVSRVRRYAPAPHAGKPVLAGLCSVQPVDAVFFKEQHIPKAACRRCKRPVAAHGHRIAVRCRTLIAVPVRWVAQRTAVDHVLLFAAPPHPVVALGHKIQLRHPPLQRHALPGALVFGAQHILAAPAALPAPQHPAAVKLLGHPGALHSHHKGKGLCGFVHRRQHHLVPVKLTQRLPHLGRNALHRHRVPGADHAFQLRHHDLHIFQQDLHPLPGLLAVPFQHAVARVHLPALAGL